MNAEGPRASGMPEKFVENVMIRDVPVPIAGQFPERITLELTNKCNLNCTFCPRRLMEKHLGFMDTHLAKTLLNEMAGNLPVTLVPFFRGESLLHPDWIEIIHYAKQKGIGPIQLTTNATLMNRKAAKAMIDLELDFISFSIDTLDPEIYEKTRRGANYQVVTKNILQLLDLREKKGLGRPEVQVSAVETREHRQGMDAFVSFWASRADRVRVYLEHSQDGQPGSIAEPLPHFHDRRPCHKVFTDMVICWDGEVAICNHDWIRDPTHRLGNVKEQGIASLWQSPRYQAIRRAHERGTSGEVPLCDACDHWKMYYLPEGLLGRVYSESKRLPGI